MAGGKLSPRQKMINMMYLVLTALLAMNVSKEIINAFTTVNHSIETSNGILADKNSATMENFKAAAEDPQTAAKAKVWKERADKIQSLSADMNKYIEGIKEEIMVGAGKKEGSEEFKLDDLDVATRILIEDGKGTELYDKMLKYKKDVIAALDPDGLERDSMAGAANTTRTKMKEFETSLPIRMEIPKSHTGQTYEENGKGWSESNFHMTPSIAALTILSKLQNDVSNSETQLSDYCFESIGKVKLVYDAFQAIASANTNYCMPGDPIKITAGIGAFSSQAQPTITIGGNNVQVVSGKAVYETTASGGGTHKVPVVIKYTKPDGTEAIVNEEVEYTVGTPSGAAVQFDKMNVLYIGVPNPLTVKSAKGDELTRVSLSTGGSISKNGGGKYTATVNTPTNDANIIVNVEGEKTMNFPVRIKRIPDPVATLGGKIKSGPIPKGTLIAQTGIIAILENFDFDARFTIKGYTFLYSSGGDAVQIANPGPMIGANIKSVLNRVKPKDIVVFDDITAVGPDGTNRKIPPLAFTIR